MEWVLLIAGILVCFLVIIGLGYIIYKYGIRGIVVE